MRRGALVHVALPHPRLGAARFPCEGAYCYYVANAKEQAPKREVLSHPRAFVCMGGGAYVAPERGVRRGGAPVSHLCDSHRRR